MVWKALFVPLWSKSWHKQPTIKPRHSRLLINLFMPPVCWDEITCHYYVFEFVLVYYCWVSHTKWATNENLYVSHVFVFLRATAKIRERQSSEKLASLHKALNIIAVCVQENKATRGSVQRVKSYCVTETYREHTKHWLCHIEGVPPVVVNDIPIILPHC